MAKKEHYATRYKREIATLQNLVYDYYDAVYDARLAIQNRNGLKATPIHAGRVRMEGHEERMPVRDYEKVCAIIEGLPLIC